MKDESHIEYVVQRIDEENEKRGDEIVDGNALKRKDLTIPERIAQIKKDIADLWGD